ncbi:hypothetical protein KEM54_006995 [Ascosphaera aggregata]|nr:hypothetical protein KEM54_006995 [Ascosphaera aggregata]
MTFNLVRRAALKPSFLRPITPLRPVRFSSTSAGSADATKSSKKDPELLVLLGVLTGALGIAGWYFGRNPVLTTGKDAHNVHVADSKMPWQIEGNEGQAFKYQYHPKGDDSQISAAPSALNEVVVPNVTLPVDIHEKFNKYGKEDY